MFKPPVFGKDEAEVTMERSPRRANREAPFRLLILGDFSLLAAIAFYVILFGLTLAWPFFKGFATPTVITSTLAILTFFLKSFQTLLKQLENCRIDWWLSVWSCSRRHERRCR